MSAPMALPLLPLVHVFQDNEADYTQAINIITHAFDPMSISNAIISDTDRLQGELPPTFSFERRWQHYYKSVSRLASSGAHVVHTGDWSVVAVWEPPDSKTLPRENPTPLVHEWVAKNSAVKRQYMPDPDPTSTSGIGKFWHLGYIARDPHKPKVARALSAAILPYLNKAKADGLPAWLHAATPYSRDVYKRYGFRVVDVVTIGTGTYGLDGRPQEGGEGVSVYCMIFDAHLRPLA